MMAALTCSDFGHGVKGNVYQTNNRKYHDNRKVIHGTVVRSEPHENCPDDDDDQ